jgi:superfamily I DNA and RNA helicase
MSLTLRTTLGCTEAVIDDDGGLKRFYQVANILSDDLDVSFKTKEDDFDSIDWQFQFNSHLLTLHYSIYTGVSIFPAKTREALQKVNKAVAELASVLESKLINLDMKKHIA